MSRFVAVTVFGIVFASSVLAQAPAPTASTSSETPVSSVPIPWANKLFIPNIEKNPAQAAPPIITHDFGLVPHGTLCVHKFTITNIYDVPIQVIDVRRSSGSLEAYPPQKVLQPNESAEFAISMNTAKFAGANTQTFYVTFGPNYISTAIVKVSANSRTDVQLNPGQVNFGTINVGAKPSQTVSLEYHGRQRDWKVTGVVPPTGPIDVEVKESGRGFLATKYYVTVALKPGATAGQLSEIVHLTTNDPTSPVLQIAVTGVVQSPVMLSTDQVKFEKVKVGDTVTQKLMVRGTTGPFKILAVPDDGDGLIVETFPAPAPIQIVTIRYTPSKAGAFRKEVSLKTDLGQGGTRTLVIEADAVP